MSWDFSGPTPDVAVWHTDAPFKRKYRATLFRVDTDAKGKATMFEYNVHQDGDSAEEVKAKILKWWTNNHEAQVRVEQARKDRGSKKEEAQ
jgi:hypothetical protein